MIEKYQTFTPKIGKNTWIHSHAVVSGKAALGDDVSVWPCAVIRGDVNDIIIGNKTNIQDNAVIHATHVSDFNPKGYATFIGDEVTVGHGAIIHGCTIKNRVLIGMGVTVLDGSVINDDIIIGANSLIPMNKVLESGYLYLGSPVKQIRKLTEKEIEFLKYSASHYAKLKKGYE